MSSLTHHMYASIGELALLMFHAERHPDVFLMPTLVTNFLIFYAERHAMANVLLVCC